MKPCEHCARSKPLKRLLKPAKITLEKTVTGRSISREIIHGHKCEECGTEWAPPLQLHWFDLEIAEELASAGPITAETFHLLRAALRMKQTDLAALLDRDNVTISRYETNKLEVPIETYYILGLLIEDEREGNHFHRDRLVRIRKFGRPNEVAKKMAPVPNTTKKE